MVTEVTEQSTRTYRDRLSSVNVRKHDVACHRGENGAQTQILQTDHSNGIPVSVEGSRRRVLGRMMGWTYDR